MFKVAICIGVLTLGLAKGDTYNGDDSYALNEDYSKDYSYNEEAAETVEISNAISDSDNDYDYSKYDSNTEQYQQDNDEETSLQRVQLGGSVARRSYAGADTHFRVCEGKRASMRCPRGYKIEIRGMWYGRPANERSTCPGPNSHRTCPLVWNRNRAIRACNGRDSCSFGVTNELNGGDPCGGIYKFQAIHARCVRRGGPRPPPPQRREVPVILGGSVARRSYSGANTHFRVCEGKRASMRCPRGYRLRVRGMWYGRPANERATCPGPNSHKTCRLVWNRNRAIRACNGRPSCSFGVTNQLNGGDPCGGIYKFQAIHAICQR